MSLRLISQGDIGMYYRILSIPSITIKKQCHKFRVQSSRDLFMCLSQACYSVVTIGICQNDRKLLRSSAESISIQFPPHAFPPLRPFYIYNGPLKYTNHMQPEIDPKSSAEEMLLLRVKCSWLSVLLKFRCLLPYRK